MTRLAGLDRAAFLARFGDVFEHSPWVLERAFDARGPFRDVDGVIEAARAVLADAEEARKLDLLRAHPDLAGKAARAGDLTAPSAREQAGAGLDRLSAAEYERFHAMNEAYKAKFGFPFIVAVKGLGKADILAAYEARLENDRATEFATALEQVARIARLRLDDAVAAFEREAA